MRRHVAGARVRVTHAEINWLFEQAQIPHVFLKGPSTGDWLFDGARESVDVDVLVSPAHWEPALRVLHDRGCVETMPGIGRREGAEHSVTFVHPNGCEIDVHATIPGVGVPPSDVWEIVGARISPLAIAHRPLPVLHQPLRLLVMGLAAARDGRSSDRTTQDLARAMERPASEWQEAAAAAQRLDASSQLRAGLEVAGAKGADLADQIGLDTAVSAWWQLTAESASEPVIRLARLAEMPWKEKVRFTWRELFPTSAWMRLGWPGARKGRLGLLRAYVQRWVWLARIFPHAALRVYRTRRKMVRSANPDAK